MKITQVQTILVSYLLIIQLTFQVFSYDHSERSDSDFIALSGGRPLKNISRLIPVSQDERKIKFAVVGDIMMDRHVAETIKEHNNDPTFPFRYIKKTLDGIDIKIANLEAQITSSTRIEKPVVPCGATPSGCCGLRCYFKTDKNVVEGLSYAGFNLLLLENNHIEDYYGGRQDTINTLNSYNMPWIDAKHSLELIGYRGCNLHFFNYDSIRSEDTEERVKSQIEHDLVNAKSDDFKAVLIHGGHEYGFNETEKQRVLAHAAIDSGADIVLFSHAHVVLGYEIYREKFIFWGLGNFVFDQFFSERVKQFLMVQFDLVDCKKVVNVKRITGIINNSSQPIETASETIEGTVYDYN